MRIRKTSATPLIIAEPSLLNYEFANVAVAKSRRGGEVLAQDALALYATLRLRLHDVDPAGAFELAHRYALSAYDAAYLWLAAELESPLATFDRKLGQAAIRHLGSLG